MTEVKLTPAMRQYMDAKKDVPEDAILLFRMGDFYELFFEDAKRAAPLMDIVLTKRSNIPMCGVPYHSAQTYIARLVEAGCKVAIAEQVEDPKLAKGLVKREVTQVITPGTLVDDGVLKAAKSNFLVAVSPVKDTFGIALFDVSTADFRATEVVGMQALETEIHRLQPAELLVPFGVLSDWEKEGMPDFPLKMSISPIDDWTFEKDVAADKLTTHFEVASLDGFGCRGLEAAVSAAGAVFYYAQNNLRRDIGHLTSFQIYHTNNYMVLDRISQRNLELVEPIFADAKNSTLISVLNQTMTPMGARMMREWILRPLQNPEKINQRLDTVGVLVEDPLLLSELREALTAVRDLERTIMRVNLGSANARDMLVLNSGLSAVPGIRLLLEEMDLLLIEDLRSKLVDLPELTDLIERAVADEPPITIREGGIIRKGYDETLDELRSAATEGKGWIASIQAKEQEQTGVKSLKVRYNKVFGYYIEITKANLATITLPDEYIRKQTLVNAERYITPELKEIESKVLGSEEKSKALEYELFQALREEVVKATPQIQQIARSIATVDVLAALSEVAGKNDYSRPELTEEPILDITDGRHPVLDSLMKEEQFVPNDVYLDSNEQQIGIITGPNMAGKSTYIRQVALLVLMAQMGSFIPAKKAKVGIVDRVFTRVGAADDLSRGQSTFMVEMVETANILNNATSKSLIILDEIGRGTSTFDGLSLAWAIAEFLHDEENARARTLFATHYHELTELKLTKPRCVNYNVAVKEYGEKIIFLRKILPGGADQSYGIHVARLAGLPKNVITRAREVLTNLEGNAVTSSGQPKIARSTTKKRRSQKEINDQHQPTLFDW